MLKFHGDVTSPSPLDRNPFKINKIISKAFKRTLWHDILRERTALIEIGLKIVLRKLMTKILLKFYYEKMDTLNVQIKQAARWGKWF